jgi:hypothetical protein
MSWTLRNTKKNKKKNTNNRYGKNTTRGSRIKTDLMEKTAANKRAKIQEQLKKQSNKKNKGYNFY